ncbi:MAG: sensor histidine kinase [Candidatus Omnitrophota bacterium]
MPDVPQESARQFYRSILMMQEAEKKRISRDLHDEVGQVVVGLDAAFNLVERELRGGNIKRALELISESRKLVKEIAAKMKSMAFILRPPALDVLGLSAAMREYFGQCSKANPIKIEFNENMKEAPLPENVNITLYRIVQEAMFNILKHSQATKVKVDLLLEKDVLRLFIQDNGIGFDIEEHIRNFDAAKMGLRGIKDRVDLLGGSFTIESTPGKNTRVNIELPIKG